MNLIIIFAILLSITGCATTPSPREMENRRIVAETIPTCKTEKECEVKWAAARNWILSNAGWKLQHAQSDFLETYNPVGYSTNIAVRVIKQPQKDGSYKINGTIWCANMFGCIPDTWEALKLMNEFINSSWKP